MNTSQFRSSTMQAAFSPEARYEVGADDWFCIVYDEIHSAVVVSETGALVKIDLPRYVDLRPTIEVDDSLTLNVAQRIAVLHGITQAQRARAVQLKHAPKGKRAQLLSELRALRSARQRYDALVAASPAIVR